jgi:outer membrane immunogenic protein
MRPYLRYLLSTVSTLTPISASLAQSGSSGDWTGPYFGLNVSATRHKANFDGHDALSTRTTAEVKKTGATVGLQLGYNWQSQNLVYGIEADLSSAGKAATGSGTFGSPVSAKLSQLGTIRGRVGTLVSPSTLLYGTGGYAWGRVKNDTAELGGFRDHSSKSGWTVGGGVEHAFARQWTVKAELLHVDLGSSRTQGFFGSGYDGTFKNKALVGSVGANFRF